MEGARLPYRWHEERASYVVEGRVDLLNDGGNLRRSALGLQPGWRSHLCAGVFRRPIELLWVGSLWMGPRHIWWNFVSSSSERIEQAKGLEGWQVAP